MSESSEPPLRLEFEISDPAEEASLFRWLEWAPEVTAAREGRPPAADRLGAADILTAIGSSSALIALIKAMPEYLRSRRSSVTVTIRSADGREVSLDASNVADASAVVERLLER